MAYLVGNLGGAGLPFRDERGGWGRWRERAMARRRARRGAHGASGAGDAGGARGAGAGDTCWARGGVRPDGTPMAYH